MKLSASVSLRSRLTFYYMSVLTTLLLVYAATVFTFQRAALTKQMLHDEVQDIVTVEGLLYFDSGGRLQLHQDYFSRPQSHLLVDRMLEVRDASDGALAYRSPNLHDLSLGGSLLPAEGDRGFDERRVTLADGTQVFVVSHIHGMGQKIFVIRLAYSLDLFHERIRGFLGLLLLAIPCALLLAGLAGQIVTARALHPLGEMSAHAERITATNLDDRLVLADRNDELGQMAMAFNQLLQRLHEAFTQLERFTADAAHELRTPLAALRATGEVALQQERSPEEYRGTLSSMLEETARLSSTIDSLLLLARAEATQGGEMRASFLLQPLVTEAVGVLEILAEDRGIRIIEHRECDGDISIHGERDLLRLAILNVLHNAVKFSPSDGVVTVRCVVPDQMHAKAAVEVEDEGSGISQEEQSLVFERFYVGRNTPANTQSGSGLGLAIAKLIVTRLGGTLDCKPRANRGTRFTLTLPIEPPFSTPRSESSADSMTR